MNIQRRLLNSMKWSSFAELAAKLISPITNMILARILAPEAFGVLATVIMVISFAEIFVDSGLQNFLIQHIFRNEAEEREYMSVAFWTNLGFAFVLWGAIAVFNRPIAAMVGAPELGHLITVTGVTIPLYGMIGVQSAKLKKDMEFKTLFYIRMFTAVVPLVITIPLALFGLEHWALIIGNISGILGQFVILTLCGRFKPMLFYSFSHLKEMLRYGVWTLLDGVAVWLTAWVDSLLIARYMSDYYLGLYKNSTSMINSIFAMVISAITPVLFSALSKLQNETEEFNKTFLSTQKVLCLLLLPAGVGLSFYRNLATNILFGQGWSEAADIVGLISVTLALRTIFTSFYSSIFRAKGKFHIPLVLQLLSLAMMIPSYIFAARQGFWELVNMRALMNLNLIIPEMIAIYAVCKVTPWRTIKEMLPPIVATLIMACVIFVLQRLGTGVYWEAVSIAVCICVYFGALLLFEEERSAVMRFLKRIFGRSK